MPENNSPEQQITIPKLPGAPPTLSLPFVGGADPITAGFNAAAAFFNFLSTTQGQRVVADIITLDEKFAGDVHDLFLKIKTFIEKKV
jgi:hypothetical protein